MPKKLTLEIIIVQFRKVHGDKYNYSKFIYWGNSIKGIIICPEHGEFEQTPAMHKRGSGCPTCGGRKKLTLEEVIVQFREIYGDYYNYDKFIYVSSHIKGIIICPEHGEFKLTPDGHKNGTGCPKCGKTGKLTLEEIIVQFREVHGDKYDYSEFIYINGSTKGIIICPEHGRFLQEANRHKRGTKCPNCYSKIKIKNFSGKIDLETVILQFRKIHGDKYRYEKFIYVDNVTKGIIICPEHGEFLQTAKAHKQHGCPKCSKNYKLTLEEIIIQFREVHGNKYDYSEFIYINGSTKGIIICPEHGRFLQAASTHKCGHACPKCNTNQKEIILIDIFKKYNINFVYNTRDVIQPLELDIYIPKFNFAVEHNGLIWHSYGISEWSAIDNYDKLNKKYHLNKTSLAEKKDIQLFHIREDHILDNQKLEIWKSMLLNKCNISNKIHARKLILVNLEGCNDFVNSFLNNNHLQGNCPSKIKLGLQDPKTGIIYSIMTFGKSRFNKNIEWELLRFCNLRYHNVRGAASKLLNGFERWYNPESLISYANRDWSQGNLYQTLGFEFSHASEPNYIYTNVKKEIITRQTVQKHKLKDYLETKNMDFDENLSERDNMISNGYRIFYDTGNLVYHKFYNKGENICM